MNFKQALSNYNNLKEKRESFEKRLQLCINMAESGYNFYSESDGIPIDVDENVFNVVDVYLSEAIEGYKASIKDLAKEISAIEKAEVVIEHYPKKAEIQFDQGSLLIYYWKDDGAQFTLTNFESSFTLDVDSNDDIIPIAKSFANHEKVTPSMERVLYKFINQNFSRENIRKYLDLDGVITA